MVAETDPSIMWYPSQWPSVPIDQRDTFFFNRLHRNVVDFIFRRRRQKSFPRSGRPSNDLDGRIVVDVDVAVAVVQLQRRLLLLGDDFAEILKAQLYSFQLYKMMMVTLSQRC